LKVECVFAPLGENYFQGGKKGKDSSVNYYSGLRPTGLTLSLGGCTVLGGEIRKRFLIKSRCEGKREKSPSLPLGKRALAGYTRWWVGTYLGKEKS